MTGPPELAPEGPMRGFLLGGTWLRLESWLCCSPAPAPPPPAPAPPAVPLVWVLFCCCGCGCCGAACGCCWGAVCCWCWFCCCWFWGKERHNTVIACSEWICELYGVTDPGATVPVEKEAGPPARGENTARMRVWRNASSLRSCTLYRGIQFAVHFYFLLWLFCFCNKAS